MTIARHGLAVYKKHPARVEEAGDGDKLQISLPGGETLRVREKDLLPLHPGPCAGVKALEEGPSPAGDVEGAFELLLDNGPVPFREFAELVYGDFTPDAAWGAYRLLEDGLYFSGSVEGTVQSRGREAVEADLAKRREKEAAAQGREAFLRRLRAGALELPGDGRLLQEVEALAYGQTGKSRTLKDLALAETPEEAHRLLLACGFWTPFVNPYPQRFGCALKSPQLPLAPPPEEPRVSLSTLPAFAIDNAWTTDPDDALSIDGDILYVHVADPAASLLPDSALDLEARGRGATLYLPEGISRMLPEEALAHYALGASQASPALTFKIPLGPDGAPGEAEIFPSLVRVRRLSYEEADALLASGGAEGENEEKEILKKLAAVAEANEKRRAAAGAVSITLPEVHITVQNDEVAITPEHSEGEGKKAAGIVRECMLLAGEAAGKWALSRRLPFPFISQEAGDFPEKLPAEPASSYQLRRCMRPRALSCKPGDHQGLGLDLYTQVTSPLRRYTDLLAHQQIRAFLRQGAYRDAAPLDEEALLTRLVAGEQAAAQTVRAERASRAHWTAVYLLDKPQSRWDAVAVDRKGGRTVALIPALGVETQVSLRPEPEYNAFFQCVLKGVRLPECELVFAPV